MSPSADEVDDLESVSVVDGRFGPFAAGSDRAVVFNGYPVALEFQGGDQIGDRCWRRKRGEFAVLAVYDEMHELNLPVGADSSGGGRGKADLSLFKPQG